MSFVFRPSRMVGGKRVRSERFSGRYSVEKGGRLVTVGLNTPDREVAIKRLRDVVVEKQREAEGLIAPRVMRESAVAPISKLLLAYEDDLRSMGRRAKHVHDTMQRIRRIFKETGWRALGEIRANRFVIWRGTLSCSAKTKKEYQISLNAFLNWLIQTERLEMNPLAKIDCVETRGKQVRNSRAFTRDELVRLFKISGHRRLAYQTLLYTGQRKSEVRALVWGDLHLEGTSPYALFRESTTKDKDKRAVPLKRELADAFLSARPKDCDPSKEVFWFAWPTYDVMRSDLKKAGIGHKNSLGQVVHFHSFRKTFQTLGVNYGINQRSAQEFLGHSDANLTAKAYTDVPALALHAEIAKLPWIPTEILDAPLDAPVSGNSGHPVSLAGIFEQMRLLLQGTGTDGISHTPSLPGTAGHILKMAARAGIEPATK